MPHKLPPAKTPASAVTTMRKGNTAIKTDSAIWLAIAQPSSRLNPAKASTTIRKDLRGRIQSKMSSAFSGDLIRL
jgi:hypothetical protein